MQSFYQRTSLISRMRKNDKEFVWYSSSYLDPNSYAWVNDLMWCYDVSRQIKVISALILSFMYGIRQDVPLISFWPHTKPGSRALIQYKMSSYRYMTWSFHLHYGISYVAFTLNWGPELKLQSSLVKPTAIFWRKKIHKHIMLYLPIIQTRF